MTAQDQEPDPENQQLRQIISDCVAALGTGAFTAPECTIEFLKQVPLEIRLSVEKLTRHNAALSKSSEGGE
jgi:hypothetical protein